MEREKDDLERLKRAARALLSMLEMAVVRKLPVDEKEVEMWVQVHDRLFGSKVSLASTLVTISDLLLKLGSVASAKSGGVDAGALSEADVALVEAFVKKMQGEKT